MADRDRSTLAPAQRLSLRQHRLGRNVRRVPILLLVPFLVLGAANVFGARTGEVSSAGAGYELVLSYPEATRSGLAIEWELSVRRSGGFDAPVVVATTADYLTMLDESAIQPQPAAATNDGERVLWRFDPPPGETLTIRLDARTDPSAQRGRSATTAVLEEGRAAATVEYETKVFP